MDMSIIGSGYVGTTVAACFADLGHDVVNIDIDESVVDTINAGDAPIHEEGLSEHIADNLQDLWRNHRAKTYYQDGLAARERAERMYDLAAETHEYVVNQSTKKHECICN